MTTKLILNKGYGYKMANYNPLVDDLIVFQATFMIIDNDITLNNAIFNYNITASFNNNSYLNASNSIQVVRNGTEAPSIIMNTTFLSNADTILLTKLIFIFI